MGCVLACFRLGNNGRKKGNLVAASPSCSKSTEHLVSVNQFASVLLCQEKDSRRLADPAQDSTNGDSPELLLLSQAQFLLACGAILETPAEFPKGCRRLKLEVEQEDSTLLETPPLLNASLQNSTDVEPTNQILPVLLPENGKEGFSVCKLRSCEPAESQTSFRNGSPLSLLMLEPQRTDLHTNKTVDFEVVKGYTATVCLRKSNVRDISTPEINQQRELLDSKQSPYPTPLNMTDELQTPGTIYPMYMEKVATIRDGIRSEFIYPETKIFVDTSQWKVCRDESYHFSHRSDEQINSGGKYLLNQSSNEHKPPSPIGRTSEPLFSVKPCSSILEAQIASGQPPKTPGSPAGVVPGLSQWQEPTLLGMEIINWEVIAKEKLNSIKNSDQDRPIIGAVAAHWREDEIPQVSPKQWNGNGVPNSTSKYKEDQKVSWHATPFEQRLEKALIDENLFPRVALQDSL